MCVFFAKTHVKPTLVGAVRRWYIRESHKHTFFAKGWHIFKSSILTRAYDTPYVLCVFCVFFSNLSVTWVLQSLIFQGFSRHVKKPTFRTQNVCSMWVCVFFLGAISSESTHSLLHLLQVGVCVHSLIRLLTDLSHQFHPRCRIYTGTIQHWIVCVACTVRS